MTRLRSVLFWSHLAVGTTAGLAILVMSATGALLALKPQIVRFVDRDVRVVDGRGAARAAVSRLLAAVREARPGASVSAITVERDDRVAAAVATDRGIVYVDPYSRLVLGDSSAAAQSFFRTLENWHRWLGAPAENRAAPRAINDAANAGFLLLALSGLYLWWPRRWTPQHTGPILTFRRAATARARDFNWHNVIGFWCAPVIVVMTATGVVMSYRWANDLLYRVTGSPLPAAAPARGGSVEQGSAGAADRSVPVVDAAWDRAERLMPSWSAIALRLPNRAGAPIVLTLTDGDSWNAFARSQLSVDAASGEMRQWQPYDRNSLGQKARGWARFAHTGELFGVVGQIVAGVACVGGVVLVWTGLALALRRLVGWRLWKRLRARRSRAFGEVPEHIAAVAMARTERHRGEPGSGGRSVGRSTARRAPYDSSRYFAR